MTVRLVLPNKSSTDLSAYDGYAVKFDTDGLNVCSAITDQAIGILTKAGATESEVCIHGECLAKCGAAVTAAKHVIPHTDGTVKNTTASSQEFALALETGVTGQFVNVFVLGSNKTVA
jgi:bacterioferritin-associated ferredoxin